MASFVTLLRSPVEGLGPVRLAAVRRAVRDSGATVREYFLTSGEYDAVLLLEARDGEAAAAIDAALTAIDDVEAHTARAWPESDIRADVRD